MVDLGSHSSTADTTAGAVLDRTRTYRYRLWRRWAAGNSVLFVLLNPSTADAEHDDPTLRRCVGFARRWGFGGVEIVNLFALRATDPRHLRNAVDPVGPDNNRQIRRAAQAAELVVAGWGNHGARDGRAAIVSRLLGRGRTLHCLGVTRQGQPRHPLYVAAQTPPFVWQ